MLTDKRPLIVAMISMVMLTSGFSRSRYQTAGHVVGQPLDSLHGVVVYYNGNMDNVTERNLTADHYNLGLKYQCVEFVKRYYYQHYAHKMPESYGNAREFFGKEIPDGGFNTSRNLTQYTNPSARKPQVGDLVVYDGTMVNPYGHVAIISAVTDTDIEIIQQNPGPDIGSRRRYRLDMYGGRWKVAEPQIMGWLRKE